MTDPSPLKELAISDTGFVFDPFSGATFTLNRAGHFVLLLLRDGLTIDTIAQRLRDEFDDVPDDVGRDLSDFVLSLRHHALLPTEAPQPGSDSHAP